MEVIIMLANLPPLVVALYVKYNFYLIFRNYVDLFLSLCFMKILLEAPQLKLKRRRWTHDQSMLGM